MTSASEADPLPQFSNLRIFRRAGAAVWRPLSALGIQLHDALAEPTAAPSSSSRSSPIIRVSMATLLEQLQAKNQPGSNDIVDDKLVDDPTTTEAPTTTAAPTTIKESPIRRIILPAGSVVYSRNDNASQSVVISINPQLRTTSPPNSATTTTTTTAAPTTTTTNPKTNKPYPTIISQSKSNALKVNSTSELTSTKKKIKRPNSPIYYIKLPSTAFVPVAVNAVKPQPAAVSTTTQSTSTTTSSTTPSPPSSTTTEVSTEEESTPGATTTTLKPARTNSRIIAIKGPFTFNGNPSGIYSSPAPYRAPNYLEILNDLYPKLKRAQFIRRRK